MNKIRNLFATPKKAAVSVLCIAIILFLLGAGAVFAVNTIARRTSIGEENARTLAFSDAGIDPAAAEKYDTEFDFEQGTFVYDVDFTAQGASYEYRLRASDGAILKKEVSPSGKNITHEYKTDINGDAFPEQSDASAKQETAVQDTAIQDTAVQDAAVQDTAQAAAQAGLSQENSSQISLDTAKSAALSDAGVSASDVTYTKEKRDYEDGIAVYDIEFYTSTHKYEYEINAQTGAIYSKDVEIFSSGANQTGAYADANTYISEEAARNAAVSHAGFSAADVTFSKTELDRDDGQMEYEIEFYKDGREYEYKINAVTGAVMEYDID